ncbi:MAG: acyltransferase [Planctomycetales bacterium]|nr:acyltransferase [Planctomycetales bacterium]
MAEKSRVTFLDFARGFSMIAVVLYHTLQPAAEGKLAMAIRFGGSGVHAFLFLSGFGLMMSSLKRPDLQGFFTRRFKRVLLPYYLFVTFIAIVSIFLPLYPGDGLRAYLGHILLFRMFDESIIVSFGYHLWFLATIIQFYLIYPLLFRVYQRLGGRTTLCLAILISTLFGILTVWLDRTEYRIYNSSCLMFLWEFVFGMVVAEAYISHGFRFWETSAIRVGIITILALIAEVLLVLRGGEIGQLLNNPAAMFAFGGLTILTYRLIRYLKLVWFEQAILWFAKISYEVYLVHGVIVTRLYYYLAPTALSSKLMVLACTFTLSLVCGELYYRLLSATLFRNERVAAAKS